MEFFLTTKSNIQEQKYYQQQRCSYLCAISNIEKIHCSKISSILAAVYKHIIPNTISLIKVNNITNEEISAKCGVIKATPNHPAPRLTNKPDNTRSHGLVNRTYIN